MSKRLAFLVLVVGLAACGNNDTKLRVTGLDPNTGDADGGSYLKVHGNGFLAHGTPAAKIYFNNTQGTVVRFASDTEMIAQAPGMPNGVKVGEPVDVLITFEGNGEIKLPKAYSFVVKGDQDNPSANKIDWKSVK